VTEAIGIWLMTVNPVWIFMIFPLLFGSIALSCWRDHLKAEKLKRNPNLMTDGQYINFNRERFNK
jgi:hypothetical protein